MATTSYKPKLTADATYENLQLVARDLLAKIDERYGSAGPNERAPFRSDNVEGSVASVCYAAIY